MNIGVLVDCHAIIGGSPTWSPAKGAIYWVDVKKLALHQMNREGCFRSWLLPAEVGAFALTDGPPGAVVSFRTGLFDLDLRASETSLVAPSPFDPDLFRSALTVHAGEPGRITLEDPSVQLAANLAVAVSLSFHELATNAVKWTTSRTRKVPAWWRSFGANVANPRWSDRSNAASGLICSRKLCHPRGTMKLDYQPKGLECRMCLPFSRSDDQGEPT